MSVFALEFEFLNGVGEPVQFDFEDDGSIDQVEVDIDLSTTWAGDIDMYLLSPDLTIITLNNSFGSDTPDIKVTFSDAGHAFLSPGNTTCECLIKPQGPGRMSDFEYEDAEGTWLLLAKYESFGPSTLNEWCVGIFPPRPVCFSCFGVEFLRGDADNNGSVSAIPDGLRILNWGAGNADAPPCMAAADVDGNGRVAAIPDGLRILNWGSGNALPPPAPFPDCGVDPDDPNLDDGPACDTDGDGVNDGGKGCAGDPGG